MANNHVGGRPEAMSRFRARYRALGPPLALAIIIRKGIERPSDEMREEIRQSFDEVSPMLACNAITILGSGFFISIVSRILQLVRKAGSRYRSRSSVDAPGVGRPGHDRRGRSGNIAMGRWRAPTTRPGLTLEGLRREPSQTWAQPRLLGRVL